MNLYETFQTNFPSYHSPVASLFPAIVALPVAILSIPFVHQILVSRASVNQITSCAIHARPLVRQSIAVCVPSRVEAHFQQMVRDHAA